MVRFYRMVILVLAVFAQACTSTEPVPAAESSTTPEVTLTPSPTRAAAPTVSRTPSASPTVLAPDFVSEFDPYVRPTVTPVPTPAPTRPPPDVGVMVIVPSGVGEHYTLYRGESRVLAYDYFPTFNADGSVWIRNADAGALVRYAPEGGELEVIEDAYNVVESVDGHSRSYALPEERVVVVERDGVRRALTDAVVRRAFSPDGERLAYYVHHTESYAASLHILDIPSGETWMLAEDIDPCPCDTTRNPIWSPSGDYLAFIDYGGVPQDDPTDRGWYVVPVEGGDPVEIGPFVGWIQADGVELLATVVPAALYDPRAAAQQSLSLPGAEVQSVSSVVGDHLLTAWVELPSAEQALVLVDPASGEELARWNKPGQVALTPDGPANAIGPFASRPPEARDCSGFWIEHPALAEPACFEDARIGWWSPDATRFAAVGQSGDEWWVEVWTPAEGVQYHFDVPSNDPFGNNPYLVGWSPDGAYLLVTWGVGV